MLAAIVVIQVLLPSRVDFVTVMVSSSFHHPAIKHSSLTTPPSFFFGCHVLTVYILKYCHTYLHTYKTELLALPFRLSNQLFPQWVQSQELIKSRVSELPPTYTTETQRWNQLIWEAQTLDCISAGVKEK